VVMSQASNHLHLKENSTLICPEDGTSAMKAATMITSNVLTSFPGSEENFTHYKVMLRHSDIWKTLHTRECMTHTLTVREDDKQELK
jgi:hypothetical protein